ncbi:S-layer homology domain-containing protein [Paenibacillus aceris]|uniref:SLH domain-containing protein n=1 Tax=Paenibacillus aceris TaxID=869555 RepID=A0ABS4I4W1_9BACL|nr:S-layer homology domain-containing protein [Paenibacillus aceris]MBP1965436.1 hypothetical protein [Paenibacillus aceris]NHW33513.1 hypothetical protein [Paenibacillus aceris]
MAKETMPNFTSAEKQESDVIPVTGVEVTNANLMIWEGQTTELGAKVLPATASNTNVTWTTSDPTVAAIKQVGDKVVVTGIKSGTATIDASFRPDETISRAEMVTLLSRIVNMRAIQKESNSHFADIGSSYAEEQIKEAAKAGIITGSGDGNFYPDRPSTRAEALTVIMNILNLNPEMKRLLNSLE